MKYRLLKKQIRLFEQTRSDTGDEMRLSESARANYYIRSHVWSKQLYDTVLEIVRLQNRKPSQTVFLNV